jgi:cytochrome b561
MAASVRYSGPAIVLHWAIAGLILANFAIGLKYGAAHGLDKFAILQWHKSIGFTILALSLLRLAWRVVGRRPPPYPAGMRAWERVAATSVHWAFYALMIGLPLTGWIAVSASPTNIPTLLYKTVPFPHLGFIHDLPMAVRRPLADQIGEVHEWLAWIMVVLFVLHVGAALKHQFIEKDGVLARMVPFLRPARLS